MAVGTPILKGPRCLSETVTRTPNKFQDAVLWVWLEILSFFMGIPPRRVGLSKNHILKRISADRISYKILFNSLLPNQFHCVDEFQQMALLAKYSEYTRPLHC